MIEKLNFLRITGPKEDINRVIRTYLTKYELHVENALSELSDVHALVPYVDTYQVREVMLKSQEAIEQLKIKNETVETTKEQSQSKEEITIKDALDTLSRMHLLIDDLQNQTKEHKKKIRDLKEKKEELRPYLGITSTFEELNGYQFMKCQFGRIAIDYYEKMIKYVYKDMNTLFVDCENSKGYIYGVYFVPTPYQMKAEAIFSSLHFEDTEFPEEYKDTPQAIYDQLQQEIVALHNELKQLKIMMLDVLKKHSTSFIAAYDVIKEYYDAAAIRKLAACTKKEQNVYYILCGWMSATDTKEFVKEIAEDQLVNCFVDDTAQTTTSAPPTKLKNPRLFRPFEMFIKMYGLPAYTEIDPTIFVALTYSFLFGMMFGDVGQGLCLVIGGFLFYKVKKQNLGAILSLAGISSTIFGFLYGSIFGFEDILEPLWVNPMHDTLTVLLTAVVFGIALILIAMVINIINGIKEKNIQKIFFDTNGVAGLVFYGTVIGTIAYIATGHTLKAVFLLVIMILVPLVLIFLREPITNKIKKKNDLIEGPIGMFCVENGFELFEVLLSYITNTISFVRVGAFALSHAGMMSVVLLLANGESSHPNFIVIVLGNIFVACLEGLIVGIQVLRLEYYEMFSRFYRGTGKEFKAKN